MAMRRSTAAICALGAAAVGCIAAGRTICPWYQRWGATDDELIRPMLLDDRIANPRVQTTMAISIAAPPEAVWPWLVQVGDPPRAGYYSYTWIERLIGMDIENSRQILPQFQSVSVGDVLDKNGTMIVQAVEPGRFLVLGPPDMWFRSTWAFGVYPDGSGGSRLVTRVRAGWSWLAMLRHTPPIFWPMYLLIDPGAFIMERKMLKEIKRLAEHLARMADAVRVAGVRT